MQLPVEHHAAANTGTHDYTENHSKIFSCAIECFTQRKTVGVIGNAQRALQQHLQIFPQRLPVQTGRIGILHTACDRRNGARRADTHGALCPRFGFKISHQLRNIAQNGSIARRLSRCHAFSQQLGAVMIQHHAFYFASTQINTDTHAFIPLVMLIVSCQASKSIPIFSFRAS